MQRRLTRRGVQETCAARAADHYSTCVGEDGVSRGQACAFYDAAAGQARVLGGGIIAGTTAAVAAKATLGADLAAAQ